ncbi:MAG: FAD:protein FMN transferase [Acidobacteria bacterium]|nr:FAD:protein FMN transferase [Acidobacteriota bacterium]
MTRPARRRIFSSCDAAGLLRSPCFIPAVLAALSLCADAGPRAGRPQLFRFSLARMGTVFNIALYHADPSAASDAAMAAFERVEQLEQIFIDYRGNSEVRRICRDTAGIARPVSPELFSVLESSLRFSRMTRGAFDVTIGPLVQVWREARRAGKAPDAAQLARARELVGYEYVLLDPEKRTVHLLLPGMRLDFGAIAKGYAADEALKVLKSRGIQRALVDAGGDISIGAPPPGESGWSVAIRSGYEVSGTEGRLRLRDTAVATSGDALQSAHLDGRRYSHIIDPATGKALRDSAAVTVIARDGLTADALATALSVLPVDEGISLVESVRGASAVILRRNGDELERRTSTGFPGVDPPRRTVGETSANRMKN